MYYDTPYQPQGPATPWRGNDWYSRPEDEEESSSFEPGSTIQTTIPQNDGSRRISTPEDLTPPAKRVSMDNDVTGGDDSGYDEPDYDTSDDLYSPGTAVHRAAMNRDDPPTSSKERAAYDDYQTTARNAPQRPKPGLWRKLGAVGVGALGGYINSGGRTHVDTSDATEGILYGDYNRRQAEWQRDVKAKADAAAMEGKRNVDVNADRTAEYRRAQLEAVKDRDDARVEVGKANAAARQTAADAKTREAKTKQEHETYKQGEQQRMLDFIDKLNVPEDVKVIMRANAIAGRGTMTKSERTNLSGVAAAEDAGILKPGEGAGMIRAGEKQKIAESDSRINKNNRAPQPRNTQTPEAKAGTAVAKKEMDQAAQQVHTAESEIQKLTIKAKEIEARKNAYEQAARANPNRTTGNADRAEADKRQYMADVQFLKTIWDPGGLYEELQKQKKMAYEKMKGAEAMLTGQPPPIMSTPAPSRSLPPVTPPPVTPPRQRVNAP